MELFRAVSPLELADIQWRAGFNRTNRGIHELPMIILGTP